MPAPNRTFGVTKQDRRRDVLPTSHFTLHTEQVAATFTSLSVSQSVWQTSPTCSLQACRPSCVTARSARSAAAVVCIGDWQGYWETEGSNKRSQYVSQNTVTVNTAYCNRSVWLSAVVRTSRDQPDIKLYWVQYRQLPLILVLI